MASSKTNAEAALDALPSRPLIDLATHWGINLGTISEHIKTGGLICHVVLHDVVATLEPPRPYFIETPPSADDRGVHPPFRRGMYPRCYPAKEVTLNGVRRLSKSGAFAFFGRTRDIEIVYEEPDKCVKVELWPRSLRMLRITRENIEKFEKHILRNPVHKSKTSQPDADTRAPQRVGAAKGAESKQNQWPKWQEDLDALRKKKPHYTRDACNKAIARKHKKNPATIQRRTIWR